MAATTVNGRLLGPLAAMPAAAQVTVTLVDYDDTPVIGFDTADPAEVLGPLTLTPAPTGAWTLPLVPNADLQLVDGSAQTAYRVTESAAGSAFTYWIIVGSSSPAWVGDLRTTLVGTSGGTAANMAVAGGLLVGGETTLNGALAIPTGAGADKVLTSDAEGNATWQTAAAGGGVTSVNEQTGDVVLDASDVSADAAGAAASAQEAAEAFATNAVAAEAERAGAAEAAKLTAAHNLSDVPDPAAARANLGITTAAAYSRQIVIAADGVPSAVTPPVGAWTPTYYSVDMTGNVFSGWVQQSGGDVGDEISFDFACDAGTYTLELQELWGDNRGIDTVKVDGGTVGTIDGYASSLTVARPLLAGIELTAGQHVVTIAMLTQNPASAGCIALIQRIVLTRTA